MTVFNAGLYAVAGGNTNFVTRSINFVSNFQKLPESIFHAPNVKITESD